MLDRFNELLSKLEQQISKSLAEARAMQAEPFERSRDVQTRFDMVSPAQDYEIPILNRVPKQYGADPGDGTAGISNDADSRLTNLADLEFNRQPASEQTVLGGAAPVPRLGSASGNDPRASLTIEKPQLASSSTQTDMSGGSETVNARTIQVQAQSSDLAPREEAPEAPAPEANSPSYTPPPPQLQVETATGQEDTPLDLSKFVEIGSGNQGGTLTVTISGLPTGASFSAGVEVAPGVWLFTEADLDGLILNPPADSDASFTLHVTATLTDAGGNSATRSAQFNVHLDAVADQPLINLVPGSGPGVAGTEDQTIAIDLEAALTDTDGSETLSITLYGIPAGATLSAGTHNADGSWTLTPGQLAGLTMNAPAHFNGDFTLHVEATATELSNGDTATTLFELPVHVAPVNDAPTNLTVDGLTVAENAAGAIIGDVSIVDPDLGDSINYTVSDSRFEIADGQLKLKDGVSLNYEAEHSVNLRMTGTDSGGLTTFKDVTVQVTDVNEAPTDLNFSSTGISMNVDGGNNSYFKIADQGDLVGGLKQMTIEIQFSGSKVLSAWDYMNLFSYHIGKGSDEIEIALDNNANGIDFTIEIGNSYTEFKNFDAYGLLDGGVHQVSLTWDSTNGAVNIYADGVLVGSKTGIATGHTIGTGGVITLGQEQDKLEGGFDPTQNFKGAYHDVRIFNEVRTATEISGNALKDVSTTEQGLVADWRMNEVTDGKTYDAVSGKDLTAMHVTGPGWIDSTPKHVAIITELSPNGTVVTTMQGIDPDTGDTLTYSVENDPSGLFEVVGNEVRVKNGAGIVFEDQQSHELVLKVTDSAGHSYSEPITVRVTNINQAPTEPSLVGSTVAENTAGAVIGKVTATDPDLYDKLHYTVSDSRFEVVDGDLKLKSGVSLDYEAEPSINLTITTVDAGGLTSVSKDFTITVTNVNDAPGAVSITNSTVAENAPGVIVGHLSSIDQDVGDSVTYTVNDSRFEVINGDLKLKTGTSLNYETTKSVTVKVTATDTSGAAKTADIKVNVTNVNEAPSTPTLNKKSIAENLVGGIVGTVAATDPDAGDTLTFSVDDSRFEIVSGQLKLKDGVSLDYETAKTMPLKITATDAGGLSTVKSVSLSVTNVNEAPTAPTLSASTVAENTAGATIGTVSATDPDSGNTITYSVDDSRFQIVSGQLKLKAGVSLDHEAEQTVNLKLTATDNLGLATEKAVAITVTNTNEAPGTPSLSNQSVAENAAGAVIGTVASADPDVGETLSYTVNDNRFEVVGGQLKLKSAISLNHETEPSVTLKVTATDAGGLSANKDFTINVTNVNDAPGTPALNNLSVAENAAGATIGTVSASDPDVGDTLSYSVSDSRFEVLNGDLKLKAGVSLNYESEPSVAVKVTATDAGGLATSQDFNISVTNVNEAPDTPFLSNTTVAENAAGATVATVSATDPDAGDGLSYSVNDGRFEIVHGELKLKSGVSLNHEGEPSVSVNVTATDAGGLATSKDFSIAVTNVNEAPTDLTFVNNAAASSNVLALNSGATTQYAQIANFSAFPTNAVTVEMRFTGINPPLEPTLFSYNASGADNEFLIIEQSGILRVSVNGTLVSTGIGHSALFDGGQHMLSVSWEKQTGALKVYLDGVQKFSGSVSAGVPISAGGTLVVGQEQDVVGGGFTASQIFMGTIDEIRIFDDVRTAQEISANATTKLANPSSEQGLISNWQMNAGGAGIVDESGNHRDLSLKNGAVLQAVVHKGAVVGQITSVADPDIGDSFTYSLQSDPSGLFEIIGGQVRLKTDAPVQIGNPQTYNLTIKVTDAGGNSYSESVSVQLADANDAPNSPLLSANTVAENSAGAVIGTVSANDPDIGDQLSYSVNDSRFEVVNGALKLKSGISLNHETEPSVSVKVTATDSGGLSSEQTFGISVTNVNEAPEATAVQGQFALRGTAFTMETSQAFSDVDAGDHLTYSLNGPAWMHIDAMTGQITGTPPVAYADLAMTNGVYTAAGEVHIDTQILSSYAAYHSSVGYYLADANGNPIAGRLLDKDALDLGNSHSEINLANYPGAVSIGFFLLPDSGSYTWSVDEGGDVSFVKAGNAWNVVWGAGGENSTAVFSNPSLNSDGLAHLSDNATSGAMNWEDVIGGGDADFNDVNMNATVRSYSEPASVVKQVTVTATDADGLTTSTTFPITVADERVDTLQGTSYADAILGGDASDTIYGNAGNDTLTGGVGADLIYGDEGNDMLSGDAGDDSLYGGIGDDIFDGGTGNDFHYGGEGGDMFLYAKGSGTDRIFGGEGQGWLDTIHVTSVSSGLDATGQGMDWTLQIENGSILLADANSLTLSQDADGSIVFNDGASVAFHDIEKIEWN